MLRVAEHFERTDTGRQRRGNEDAFYARAPLFARGRRDGRRAGRRGRLATVAVAVLEQRAARRRRRSRSACARGRARPTRGSRIARAGRRARAGMGTTLTVAYVGEDELTVAHVGDSRAYRLRDGDFERLTDDHSLVEELVRQGKLTPEGGRRAPAALDHHARAGRRARASRRDGRTWPRRDGDVFLICSDGLTSMVHEAHVARAPRRGARRWQPAGRALIDAANDAGGRDNITVVLFRLEEVGARRAARAARRRGRAPCAAAPAASRQAPSADGARGRGSSHAPPRRAPSAAPPRRRRPP